MLNFAEQNIESTGRVVEAEYFSSIKEKYYKLYGSLDNVRFKYGEEENARKAVESMQPWKDPSDPTPEFANDLHATIADMLKLEDYKNLEFYTAVGSHLDIYFGQDAFFKCKLGDQEIIVTLDLTANPNKYSSKADAIIHVPADYLLNRRENTKEYGEILQEASEVITKKIKNKLHIN